MHTIRLKGPWQIQSLEETAGHLAPPTETTVPGDWGDALGRDFRGRARYTRRFGLPTNLGPEEQVLLVVGAIDWQGEIFLNGQSLGQQTWDDSESRYDITRLLKPRNELQINVALPSSVSRPGREAQPGGLIGEVRLEIEP